MALTGTNYSERFEYVSDRDPCKKTERVMNDPNDASKGFYDKTTIEDGATIWYLGNLPAELRTSIQDGLIGMNTDGTMNTRTNAALLTAVKYGLKGVDNYLDDAGKLIKFESVEESRNGRVFNIPTPNFLATLPTWLIKELGQRIMEENSVSGKLRKN